MEKLSGLVLDAYDDRTVGCEVLKSILSDHPGDQLSELVKEAHDITNEERGRLPDEAFALVLVDGAVELKKFATIDSGNTALSIEYFLKTGHKLPEEAQKTAANNLVVAAGWYGLEVPEQLTKVALGLNTLLVGATMGPGAAHAAKSNLQAAKGAPMIMTPGQIQSRALSGGQ